MGYVIESAVNYGDKGAIVLFSDATGEDTVTMKYPDARSVLLINNTGDKDVTVTIKAGDGSTSAKGDYVFTVGASQFWALPLTNVDSSRIKTVADKSNCATVFESVPSGGTITSVKLAVVATA